VALRVSGSTNITLFGSFVGEGDEVGEIGR
jgi:hypothetical protein